MPDTVTVSETQGARYTWASAGFAWSSASAGKNWTTAYPAVYSIAVAVTLSLSSQQASSFLPAWYRSISTDRSVLIEKTFLVNCVLYEWKLPIILLGSFRSAL